MLMTRAVYLETPPFVPWHSRFQSTFCFPTTTAYSLFTVYNKLANNMGGKQSKLSPEQLADLQKHTYCGYRLLDSRGSPCMFVYLITFSRQARTPTVVRHHTLAFHSPSLTPILGTKASSKTVPPVNSTRQSSVGYINSSSRSVTQEISQITFSMFSMRTRTEPSISKNSSVPSA